MTTETIIKLSTINVISFITHSLMEHGFMLAHENELSDLKGIIPAHSFAESEGLFIRWELELELLDLVEDEAVKTIMTVIRIIQSNVRTYLLINSLDLEELASEEVRQQSCKTYIDLSYTPEYNTYINVLEGLEYFVERYGSVIWDLAYQQILVSTDVSEEKLQEFEDWLTDVESLGIEDNSAKLLLGMFREIQFELQIITEIIIQHYGKI